MDNSIRCYIKRLLTQILINIISKKEYKMFFDDIIEELYKRGLNKKIISESLKVDEK